MVSPGTESYAETLRIVRGERPDLLLYTLDGVGDLSPEDRYATLRQLAGDPTVQLRMATIAPGPSRFSRYDAASRTIVSGPVANVSHDDARYFFELCDETGVAYGVVVRNPASCGPWWRITGPAGFAGTCCSSSTSATIVVGSPPECRSGRGVPGSGARGSPALVDDLYLRAERVGPMSGGDRARRTCSRSGSGDNPVEADGSVVTNVEQVRRVVAPAGRMGRDVASPTEASVILRACPEVCRIASYPWLQPCRRVRHPFGAIPGILDSRTPIRIP